MEKCGLKLVYDRPFFHEFVTQAADEDQAQAILKALDKADILGGLPLGDGKLLWCATELNTKEEMDRVAAVVKEAPKA